MTLSGTDFELLVKPFFKTLFEKIGYKISEIRNQKSGTQNGFDIKVEFDDLNDIRRSIFIECKYYSSTLEWRDIVIKQVELWGANYEPDGFIALSPKVDLSNIHDNVQAKLNKDLIFGFPSDFWTPNKGIEEIFSIDKDIYEKVYGKPLAGTVDEPKVVEKVKGFIESLLSKRDSIRNNLPTKNLYATPNHYIARKVVSEEVESEDLGFLTTGESILETFNRESRIALLGWAGTGKSIELEYLASQLSASSNQYFPFLITLNNHVDKDLHDYVPDILKIPENNIVLILDGLDEVQAKDFENTRRRINRFSEDFPNAHIVVSCRSNFYSTVSANGNLSTLRGFKSYSLSNLTWKDIDKFLDANLALKKTSFLGEIESKNLSDLLHYPFYFRRLVQQYLQYNRIANSKADFFENVITDDIKEDVAKYFPSDRDTKLIVSRKLLERLAFILEYQGKNLCTWNELMLVFNSGELDILKRLGRTLYGEEGNESIWKFNHNNTQEYLTANFISKLTPEVIKVIITFPRSHTKVKPTWANTLSLLFSLLPDINQTRIKLTTWLANSEPELFIRFEPERIDEHIRVQVLRSILDFYKKQGTRINHSKFSILELTRFVKSDNAIDLLIQELDLSNSVSAKRNALELISYYDVEKSFGIKVDQVKAKVQKILFQDVGLRYQALKTYNHSFKLSDSEFDEVFNLFQLEKDTYLRYALFSSIHHQNYQDKYVKYVIDQINELMRHEMGNNEGRLSNEYSELKDCISNLKNREAIEYAVEFVSQNYWSISYSIYFNEIIDYVIKHSIKLGANETVYQKLKEVVLSENFSSVDKKIENLQEYFKATGTYERLFEDVYNEKKFLLDYHSYGTLALMASEKNVEFFANEFINSRIERIVVEEFQRYLDRYNTELLKPFNASINKKELIPLPVYKQFESTESIILRTKEILFEKEKFKKAIEQVFSDFGKDELSYDDVWDSRRDYEKYLPVIHDTILIRNRGQVIKKAELLKKIDENWELLSIRKLILLLKEHRNAELTDSEIQYVAKWCDKEIKSIDFQKALQRSSENSVQVEKNAVRVSFLIRRLRLSHYPKETYLDMLSFQRWDDNEMDVVDFVASVVPKAEVDKRIVANLNSSINFEVVLENHIEYALANILKDASKGLLRYLKIDGYGRYKVLDCYLKLNGSISDLENIVDDVKDDFRHKLFEELINHKSVNVKRLVLEAFNIEKDEDEKLALSTHLIKLQNIKGLRYYINYIKRNKKSIEDSSPSNALYRLTTLQAVPFILSLYELSYDKEIRQDSFNRLGDISLGALQAICRHHDNFPGLVRIFKLYKLYFKITKPLRRSLPDEVLSNFEYFIESQELEYYTRKSLNINPQDAVQKYQSLLKQVK